GTHPAPRGVLLQPRERRLVELALGELDQLRIRRAGLWARARHLPRRRGRPGAGSRKRKGAITGDREVSSQRRAGTPRSTTHPSPSPPALAALAQLLAAGAEQASEAQVEPAAHHPGEALQLGLSDAQRDLEPPSSLEPERGARGGEAAGDGGAVDTELDRQRV